MSDFAGGDVMVRRGLVLSWRLSILVAALMAIQSGVGVLVPSVYRDTGWVTAAWYGNDIVTLVVAVPLLAWSLLAARRSLLAELVWYAMLAYGLYNYGYYLFGAKLNWFFPLYVVLFVSSMVALLLALGRLDAPAVADAFADKTPTKLIGGYMLFTGLGLTFAWIAQWANSMLTGSTPNIGEEAFKLVASMDLSFVVPWFIIGAVLLVRHRPWGYVIASIVTIKGATYTLVLTATSAVAALRGVEGSLEQIPIWGVWTLVGVLAFWGLVRNIRTATGTETRGRRGPVIRPGASDEDQRCAVGR